MVVKYRQWKIFVSLSSLITRGYLEVRFKTGVRPFKFADRLGCFVEAHCSWMPKMCALSATNFDVKADPLSVIKVVCK